MKRFVFALIVASMPVPGMTEEPTAETVEKSESGMEKSGVGRWRTVSYKDEITNEDTMFVSNTASGSFGWGWGKIALKKTAFVLRCSDGKPQYSIIFRDKAVIDASAFSSCVPRCKVIVRFDQDKLRVHDIEAKKPSVVVMETDEIFTEALFSHNTMFVDFYDVPGDAFTVEFDIGNARQGTRRFFDHCSARLP